MKDNYPKLINTLADYIEYLEDKDNKNTKDWEWLKRAKLANSLLLPFPYSMDQLSEIEEILNR